MTEQIVLDDGTVAAQWLHFGNKSYDVVYTNDWTGSTGRPHHIAFATDTREDILRGADIFLDNNVFIETGRPGAGPGASRPSSPSTPTAPPVPSSYE